MKTYIINVYCRSCSIQLFRYEKEGEGHLVKCYRDNIARDYTNDSKHCPGCGTEFARDWFVHGRPAYKIIQGKVFVRK